MKNLIFILGLFLVVNPSAFAQIMDPTSLSEIGAQVGVTKRAIDLVIERFSGAVVPNGVKARDYYESKAVFEKKLEGALAHFQFALEHDILSNRAGSVMMNFNSVYYSTALSSYQKATIIDQQKSFIENQAKVISKAYAALINRTFNELGFPRIKISPNFTTQINYQKDFSPCVELEGRSIDQVRGRNFYSGQSEDALGNVLKCVFAEDETDPALVAARLMAFELRVGCRSQVCIDMRANDAIIALNLLRPLFERRIDLKLADQTTILSIQPPYFVAQTQLQGLLHPDQFGIDDLPFDAP